MQPPIHPYYLHVERNLQALWDNHHQLKKQLEDQLHAMELENNQLKERLNQIKTITIENINYKIQELTVQQLSGTLNIGLSALTDPEEIKKWLNINDLSVEHDQPPHVDPSVDNQPM